MSNTTGDIGEVTLRDGTLAVSGALTFATVPDVWERSAPWFKGADAPSAVDLAGMSHTDSAGLALLVEWLRQSASAGRQMRFLNVPEQVRSLARVNGVAKALNLPE